MNMYPLSHIDSDSSMLPHGTTVTFDTNTLDKAARPERHPNDSLQPS
jgi:hypothetical protein